MGIGLQVLVLAILGALTFYADLGGDRLIFVGLAALCALADMALWLQARAQSRKLYDYTGTLIDVGDNALHGDAAQRALHCLEQLRAATARQPENDAALVRLQEENADLHSRLTALEAEKEALQQKTEQGGSVLHKAHTVCNKLSEEVRGLSHLITAVNKGVEVQRDHLAETAQAMKRVAATASEASVQVRGLSDSAQNSSASAATGEREVEGSVASIERVKDTIVQLKEAMAGLGDKASNIGQVMSVINEVADQTNLLALNAAIEAARAGEAGRGFAVVADEVRKLAEKTMASTNDVAKAIAAIQDSTAKSMVSTENAVGQVERATDFAGQSGSALQDIVGTVENTVEQVKAIAAASDQQSATSEGINRTIDQVSTVVADTAHSMTSARHETNKLLEITRSLEQLTAQLQE